MNQQFLTNFSVVVIKSLQAEGSLYLGNESFIRSAINMTRNQMENTFENFLFCVEIQAGGEFRTPIEFEQQIFLRHKTSNKYLSYSSEFENEENDTTVKLELSDTRKEFKVLPCFQYQTKISNKVKFNQDLYLATELSSAKLGYLTLRPGDRPQEMRTLIGLNYRSKIMLQSYYEREKEEPGYVYGQAVWLSHIESSTFLTTVYPDVREKEQIAFEELKSEQPLQSINGLWLIESTKVETGGRLNFGDAFRLKNLCTGRYLAFSRNYKLVDNQRVYSLLLEERPSQLSRFSFHSLKGQESRILRGAYLIFHHEQSKEYIGTRRSDRSDGSSFLPFKNFTEFEDEDLFQIMELEEEAEQAIRFIFSIRKEFKEMGKELARRNTVGVLKAKQYRMLYINIKQQLLKLSRLSQLFLEVQEELGFSIPEFCEHIKQFRVRSGEAQIEGLLKLIYEILVILCKDLKDNQFVAYRHIMIFVADIFKNYGAEELICQIFRNNYSLLSKGPNPSFEGCNLVNQMLRVVGQQSAGQKSLVYWTKIGKVLNVLQVLTSFKAGRIDINQRLISSQLLENGMFTRVFFDMKTMNQRIRVMHPTLKRWTQIEIIRDSHLVAIMERLFTLFSHLCENRNFISKRYIHSFLSDQTKDSIEIIISYLNVAITKTFTNTLFSFITNCYIDSAPRISKHRPLALIVFQITQNKGGSRLSAEEEETIMSGRLKEALLDSAERSYATRPVDGQQTTFRNMTSQPSLSTKQLSYFKDYLTQKINDNSWTPDLLRSIRILMQLECYSVREIQEIKNLLNNAILIGKMPADIVEFAMEFFDQVCIYCLQEQLKKINTFLQLQYAQKKDITNSQISHLLPLGKQLSMPVLNTNQATMLTEGQSKRGLIDTYNKHAQILSVLYAGKQLKSSVMKMFLADHDYSFSVHSIIFKMMQKFYLPKLELVKLLSKCIIIPEEDITTYQQLYTIYKRMKCIVSISQNWMNSSRENDQHQEFLALMNRLSNYIFGELVEGDLSRARMGLRANIKHQLLLNNFYFHLLVLQLLNKNFYLIEGRTRKEVPKKVKDVFETCFTFLEYFCRSSPQNTKQIVQNIYIVDRYLTLAEMGQVRLLSILYKEEESLSKQLTISFFESIINKIVKDGKGNENCQFNPEYIQFLHICCCSKNAVIKRNLQMINKILERESLFRKLLFMERKDQQNLLCLEVVKFKNEPLQVPFIYHKELFKFLTFLIVKLEAAGNQLRNRLKKYITTDQLLQFLALPDIYTNSGVLPELNFLLKKEIFPMLHVYFEKNDSMMRYYQNKDLLELLIRYIGILVSQKEVKPMQEENQYLMMPFLRKYKKSLDIWKINLRDHFEQEIKPLILLFFTAIEKLPNKEKNNIYQKLVVLLENVSSESLTHNHLAEENIGMQMINIRWRNFVDDDENNSAEEKYAKKNVLQLLRNQKTYDLIAKEREHFYKALKKEEDNFMAAISRLVKMAVSEESTLDQEQQADENFYITVQSTAEYLRWRCKESAEEKNWEGKELVETLISFVCRQKFNYSKPLARKSLFQILRIFNSLLQEDKSDSTLKKFYKILHESHSSFRLFNSLKECIGETSIRIDSDSYFDQINLVMSEIYLCGQQQKLQIDKQALKFLSLLCKYQPFTGLLRSQPYSPSIDFLDKIYNTFYFMIRENNSDKLTLSSTIIDISESILECLTAFLNGCNQANQNFIIDNKFTDVVAAALKMENLNKQPVKVQVNRRNRLLEQIIDFYASNGINLTDVFLQRTKLLDYRGVYLLNRFKLNFLKLLLQCTLANERSTNKVRITVPNELLKINLIWLYEDFINGKQKFKEGLILRPKDDWLQAINNDQFQVFLMIGFYYFHLIEFNEHSEKENEDEEVDATNDIEKQKQKIVKKFFSSIDDQDRKADKIKSLQKEPFAEEMKMFYDKYYTAYKFFKSKTISIEANVFGNLVKLYFPKLPLCEQFTDEFKERMIENAKRISQDQKLKSLIEFQNQSYEIIEGEHQYEREIQSKSMVIGKLVKMMKNEEDVFLVVWIISCIIILLYLIDDFTKPHDKFAQQLGNYLTPEHLLDLLILLSSFCNLLIGIIILINLIVKKWPFLHRYYAKRYEQLAQKDRGNKHVVIFSKVITVTFYDIYVITFSVMSITHPLFAGFLLVYIVSRISLGKQIVQAIVETWFSLAVAASLLIVFNYIYSIYIYTATFTDDLGYGQTCKSLFRCLMMLVDQTLKSGSGFLGTATGNGKDIYLNMVFNTKFISEITYILFAQKVIFEIFSGTIIDKFSELRQKEDSTEEDEESKCYICGQERFQIDFELQGFKEHIQQTHNKFNYIYYLFYLRRKNPKDYGIEQRYIWELHQKQNNNWIPDRTSLLKEKKEADENDEKQATKEPQHQKYYEKKIQELKKVKQRIENYNSQLKDQSNQ